MKVFKEIIPFGNEKKAIQEKVFFRFYFRTTVKHITHSIPK